MKFESVIQESTRGTRNGRAVKKTLAYATYRSKEKGGKYASANFIIGVDLMKAARWQFGDRIDVLKDEESQMGLLKRVTRGGRMLSKAASDNFGRIFISINEKFPIVDSLTDLENVVLSDEGILFDWPKNGKQTVNWPSVVNR